VNTTDSLSVSMLELMDRGDRMDGANGGVLGNRLKFAGGRGTGVGEVVGLLSMSVPEE